MELDILLLKVINVEQRQAEGWMLTDEGSEVVEKGSHEFLVFKAVPPEGLPQADIKVQTSQYFDPVCFFTLFITKDRSSLFTMGHSILFPRPPPLRDFL